MVALERCGTVLLARLLVINHASYWMYNPSPVAYYVYVDRVTPFRSLYMCST